MHLLNKTSSKNATTERRHRAQSQHPTNVILKMYLSSSEFDTQTAKSAHTMLAHYARVGANSEQKQCPAASDRSPQSLNEPGKN